MGLTTLPTQTEESLGKVKKATPLARETQPDYDVTADQHNALVAAVVGLAEEVGLSDGSTAGSLVERVDALEIGGSATPSAIAPTDVGRAAVIGSSAAYAREDHVHDGGARAVRATITGNATLVAADEFVRVDTTAGSVVLTLPAPTGRRDFRIKKTSADANTITLRPHVTTGSGPSIEGGSAGADLLLPGSSATDRPAWYVVADGSAWWL